MSASVTSLCACTMNRPFIWVAVRALAELPLCWALICSWSEKVGHRSAAWFPYLLPGLPALLPEAACKFSVHICCCWGSCHARRRLVLQPRRCTRFALWRTALLRHFHALDVGRLHLLPHFFYSSNASLEAGACNSVRCWTKPEGGMAARATPS